MRVDIAIEEKIPDGMDADNWFNRMKGYIAIKLEEYGVALVTPKKSMDLDLTTLHKVEDVIKEYETGIEPEMESRKINGMGDVDKSTYLRWQNKHYELKCMVNAETDMAVELIHEGTKAGFWCPKSQILTKDITYQKGLVQWIAIQKWVLVKNGIVKEEK